MFAIMIESNSWTRLVGDVPPIARDIIIDMLSWNDKRTGQRLCAINSDLIPTGMANLVGRELKKNGFNFVFSDKRKYSDLDSIYSRVMGFENEIAGLGGLSYRQHQIEAIVIAKQKFRGVITLPPGSGKTEILLGIAETLGVNTLILSPLLNTVSQFKDRAERYGAGKNYRLEFELPDVLWKRHVKRKGRRFDGIDKLREYLSAFEFIGVDECHHIQNNIWYQLVMLSDAFFRIGTSATSEKGNTDVLLKSAVGPCLYEKSFNDMYLQGLLCKPKIRILKYNSGFKFRSSDWHQIYGKGIVENNVRNSLAISEAHYYRSLGLNPVVLGFKIDDHIKKMYMHCCEHYGADRIGLISGKENMDERKEAIAKLVSGQYHFLFSSLILGEGTDIPELSAIINLSGGESFVRVVQLCGRVTRPKQLCYVTDFADDCNGVLARHSLNRIQAHRYVSDDIQIIDKTLSTVGN